MKRSHAVGIFFALLMAGFLAAGAVWAQANAVDLSGTITDPQNAVVSGAKVSVKNLATNATRSVQSGDDGRYLFVGLAPGRYELSVEKAGFTGVVNPEVVLEIGRAPAVNVQLQVKAGVQQVTVTGEAELVETQRTAVSQTIGSREIENLPINGRNYVNFTLLNSQANRDSAPSIGAAPTSGLNFGGQRARSNEVSVDGADAVDNSVNGIRSTVSQEDVQEFQLIISNYQPEFGRATGGVINIVTKSGSNQFHGDVFGFLRSTDLQARNPFSVRVNPATGATTPSKQSYTRAQYGITFGGPIRKDKTFYFFSFEGTRRHETGFTNIGANGFDGASPITGLTPSQATMLAAFPAQVQMAYAAVAGSAGTVARRGVDPGLIMQALTGAPMPVPGPRFSLPVPCPANMLTPIPCGPARQGFAPLPASFVPLNNLIGNYPIFEGTSLYSGRIDHIWNSKNQTFVRGNVSPSLVTGIQVNAQNQNFGQNAGSRTSLQQYRDISIVAQHNTTFSSNLLNEFRFQFARRGLHYGFSDCSAALCPTLGGLADGGQVAVNITGFAFFGREPFSTVDRIERRFQWTDHVTYVMGKHTIKFGVDTNYIQLRSKKAQIFQLNFGGLYNFGSVGADRIVSGVLTAQSMARGGPPVAVMGLPDFTAIQAYGLGLPQNLIQGTGESNLPFTNTTLGAFAQDSWRITSRVTLNYGLRYDIEFTPTFTPFGGAKGFNLPAEQAFNILEGIPVYDTGLQPRIAIAWDPWGDGKTVIRAGGGLFFDHPLLAVAFDSTTADGARSSQLIGAPGLPSACGIFSSLVVPICGNTSMNSAANDGPGNLNAGSLFQGVLNTTAPAGFPFSIPYIAGTNQLATTGPFAGQFLNSGGQQRFTALPTTPQSVFVNQNFLSPTIAPLGGFPTPILPFTLPTAGSFAYGYATQANLTAERDLGHDFKISVGYQYTKGTHLNRPRNVNVANASLLTQNIANAFNSGLVNSVSQLNIVTLLVPSNVPAGGCFNTPFGGSLGIIAPGALATGFSAPNCNTIPVGFVATSAVFNFFRPSGPNPSFAALAGPAGLRGLVALANIAGYPRGFFNGTAPITVPFSDVDQQESTGNSIYHGLVVNFEKRWSQHFQFLASYTYSHAIDDSTDLQTLLTPQDSNNSQLERSNSTFDQRHRFVFSGVSQSPYTLKDGGWKAVLGDWIVAPIVEFSSGRPFTVLTGTDYALQFSSNTVRPSVVPVGTPGSVISPFIHGVAFALPNVCPASIPGVTTLGFGCTGNLGRNTFVRPKYQSLDLRISRKFKLTERFTVEGIADMFNLANRFNVGDVSPLCDPGAPTGVTASGTPTCNAGQPTAALDPRTFQFGLKLYF